MPPLLNNSGKTVYLNLSHLIRRSFKWAVFIFSTTIEKRHHTAMYTADC